MQEKERRRCSENIPARIIIYEQTTFYLSSTLCVSYKISVYLRRHRPSLTFTLEKVFSKNYKTRNKIKAKKKTEEEEKTGFRA